MPLRDRQEADPLSAQSRTRAILSAGDIETLRGDFQSDKAIQDGKISVLESDKIDKDTRMNTAETDITTLQNSATGIVDGGRSNLSHVEATDINGGSSTV